MAEWQFCVDESYNKHVFCVGGFLAPHQLWLEITNQWNSRIQYENERSAIGGFPPITRYHATDCAGLKKEFDAKNGWDIPRQIKLTKRICEIIGDTGPIGIVVGGRLSDMSSYLTKLQEKTGAAFTPEVAMASLYDLCFRMSLMTIVAFVREQFSGTQVEVIIDQGKTFASVAKAGFNSMLQDQTVMYLKDCFTTLTPKDSRTFVALQPADFMAYEAMRQLETLRKGKDDIRKSLLALIGTDIPLHVTQFNDRNFADFQLMIENKEAGRPVGEGAESILDVIVSSGYRMDLLP